MPDTNGNEISNNGDINRQSESPARTIDSHDSTTGSMDTIVDRSAHNATTILSSNNEEMMQNTIAQSTNTTNMQQQHNNSLTNSEIAMLQKQTPGGSDDELILKHQQVQQQQQQQQQQMQKLMLQQKPMDAQSHIYSSPVYDEKPAQPLKLTATTSVVTTNMKELEKPKLISHDEFKQQLEETLASRAATLDSRISKKQRFPPEIIKDDGSSSKSSRSLKKKRSVPKSSTACCSAFPVQIILGLLQLMLAISLVALGSLLIVREASLSTAGCGIWTGLIAAVTGSLGVVGLRKTQTSFLALSLVCIASSTLALAISGIGLSRDINRSKEQLNLMNTNSEISAASGLIFALFLHFIVSILSVYRCALQICSRSKIAELHDIVIKTNANGLALHPDSVDHYVRAMSVAGSEKARNEKLAPFWMYAAQTGNKIAPQQKMPNTVRPMMLIPATANLPPAARTMMIPGQQPIIGPAPMAAYRGMTLPYMRTTSMPVMFAPPTSSMPGTYRIQRNSKSQEARKKRRAAAHVLRSGKSIADRRQRRKSDADIIDGNPSFQYHGLDRAIADNFLARQEQSHVGSHLDYSSSSGGSDTYGNAAPSRASSKTKIVCRDVVM